MSESPVNPEIFVVDDDQDDQLFIREAIMEVIPHASVSSFYDGFQFIESLVVQHKKPSVVLLDLNMGVADGKTTLKVIRQDEFLKDIPIVILTTSSWPLEKEKLMNMGASAFYTKPSNPSDLKKIIEEVKAVFLDKL